MDATSQTAVETFGAPTVANSRDSWHRVRRSRHVLVAVLLLLAAPRAHATGVDTEIQLPSAEFFSLMVDDRHRRVFIAQADAIAVLDFDGNIVGSIDEPRATGMVLNRSRHILYAALSGANAIAAVNTRTLIENFRVPLDLGPYNPTTLAVVRNLIWFGYACQPGTLCNGPLPGGIGSLDARRGIVKLYQGNLSFSSPYPGFFALLHTVKTDPRRLIAATGYGDPAILYNFQIASHGVPVLQASAYSLTYPGTLENLQDIAVTPDGSHIIAAPGAPYELDSFRLPDLSFVGSYSTGPYPTAVAITADGQYVAAGLLVFNPPDLLVFPIGGSTPIASYGFPYYPEPEEVQARGMAFDATGDRLFVVVRNILTNPYAALHVISDPLHPPTPTTTTTSTTTTSTTIPACTFLLKWGAPGEFSGPAGVAIGGSGNVYVTDFYNNRVQKFDANGTFLTTWGTSGSGEGQFSNPYGIATDASERVYVSDTGNNRVQKFDASATFLTMWGSYGLGNGEFNLPAGVATDGSGNV